MLSEVKFSILKGKIFADIKVSSEEIIFIVDDKEKYLLNHSQDCCECVIVEDVCGDIIELLNSPILLAEESTSDKDGKGGEESFTWTFYKLATIKGAVTIRWYGRSSGYYSETVDLWLHDNKV